MNGASGTRVINRAMKLVTKELMVYMALGLMSGESWIYEWSIGYKGYKWRKEIGYKGMNGVHGTGLYKWSIMDL